MTEIIIKLGHSHAPSTLPVKKLRRLLQKRRKIRVFVWKGIWKNIISYYSSAFTINPQLRRRSVRSHSVLFWFEIGSGFGNRAAHPYQEFLGVTPPHPPPQLEACTPFVYLLLTNGAPFTYLI